MRYEDIPEPVRKWIQVDELIFGSGFVLKENGKYKRIDPMKVKLNLKTKEYEIINETKKSKS